jgi:hypothetical protein
MRTFLLIIILSGFSDLFAQKNSDQIKLLISSRVDTSSEDVKLIIKLYENYFKSRPDSIYNNPYWNNKEKEVYKDFDFSRSSLFQGGMSPNKLFKYFSPFLMSVELVGEKYQIRVLFSSPTVDPKYAGSKVWCIHKLNAVKQKQTWVLENLMVEILKKWSNKKYRFINYIYPPNHTFNAQEAQQSISFCDEIIKRFNPSFDGTFNYYVTSSKDDMGLLENFDYYFVGITTGKAREGMLLTAKGNEFYPHELIHKLLPINMERGYVIEEGLAVFLGTKEDSQEYETLLSKLATDIKSNPEKFNFESVLSQTVLFNGYQTAYPAGAVICELIYNLSGDNGIKQLLLIDTKDFDSMINSVCSITNLSELELETKWTETINKYYHQ